MINPSFQVESSIYLHAARTTAWAAFTRLREWPHWNREIVAAAWVTGDPWQEGSVFELRHHSLFGQVTTTTAVLRMVVADRTALWESHALGMTVVNRASFVDDRGGCKLTAQHAYHGTPTLLLRLIRARQQRILETTLQELKVYVEDF